MKKEFTEAELDDFFGEGLIIFGPGPRPPKPETKPVPMETAAQKSKPGSARKKAIAKPTRPTGRRAATDRRS